MGIKSNNSAAYYYNVFGATGTGALHKHVPQYHWYNTLTGSSNIERWYDVTISPKEGDVSEYVYAQGDTRSQGQGGYEALIAQYDKEGAIQWQRMLGSANNENYQGGVVVDSSGNVYAGGYQATNFYGLFVKYNSSGTLQFQKEYYPSGYACLASAATTNSDNTAFYHTGYITSTQGAYIVKFDSAGAVTWARKITGEGGGNAEGNGIACDSSDNVLLAFHAVTGGQHHVSVAKYNSSGTIQWQRKLVTGTNTQGYDVACDSNDNVYVIGNNWTDGTMILAKWDSSGTIQWQRKIDGVDGQGGIAIDSSDNIYVSGQVSSGSKIYWAKYNTSGTIQLQRTWDSSSSESIRGMTVDDQTPYGVSVIISGWTGNDTDAGLIVKVNADGSDTGTYGDYTYAVSSLTESANTGTESALTGTDASITMNIGDASFTSDTSTLTSSTNNIP